MMDLDGRGQSEGRKAEVDSSAAYLLIPLASISLLPCLLTSEVVSALSSFVHGGKSSVGGKISAGGKRLASPNPNPNPNPNPHPNWCYWEHQEI